MATIKDVAKLAGVSVTTVSIIINGKAKERKIPDSTTDRVLQAMFKLDYQPNTSARRLRSNEQAKPTVAFYWPIDYRANMLADLLLGFQNQLTEQNFDCELIIQPYQNDRLSDQTQAIVKNSYNAIIIGAASQQDIDHLESIQTQTPIILINRKSARFSTIETDTQAIGEKAAQLFKQKKHGNVAVITAQRPYIATGQRTQAFLYACANSGIDVNVEHIFRGSNSFEGGYEAAKNYLATSGVPKAIYCESDSLALGALHAFYEADVKIPAEVEILAIGMLGKEHSEFSNPSLSVIAMPIQKISKEVIATMIKAMSSKDPYVEHISIEPEIHLRASFSLR